MNIDVSRLPFAVEPALITLLQDVVMAGKVEPGHAVTVTFRDPTYSFEAGGFHPVEIGINAKGVPDYITDFSLVGVGPFAELAKEIDFDFSLKLFQHFGQEYPIDLGADMFELWQQNFLSYHAMGIYTVETQAD
jgi:hypothetical protein